MDRDEAEVWRQNMEDEVRVTVIGHRTAFPCRFHCHSPHPPRLRPSRPSYGASLATADTTAGATMTCACPSAFSARVHVQAYAAALQRR